MKAKEDPELERKVGEWIEDVTGLTLEDTGDLWKSLKSGVVLCVYVLPTAKSQESNKPAW